MTSGKERVSFFEVDVDDHEESIDVFGGSLLLCKVLPLQGERGGGGVDLPLT